MIKSVVIACIKSQLSLTRICVASVRYWYPNIPIFLLKDTGMGEFDTADIERTWQVQVFPRETRYGSALSKLEVFFSDKREKLLLLDSDTVLLGPVLDRLNEYEEDFVVTGLKNADPNHPNMRIHYFYMDLLRDFDPEFTFPGFGFNTGQIVITTGLLDRRDFFSVVDFGVPMPQMRLPQVTPPYDQGVINYVLCKVAQQGRVRVVYDSFWIWGGIKDDPATYSIERITAGELPYVMHWSGGKPPIFSRLNHSHILDFYERFYYTRVRLGEPARLVRRAARRLWFGAQEALAKLRRHKPEPSSPEITWRE